MRGILISMSLICCVILAYIGADASNDIQPQNKFTHEFPAPELKSTTEILEMQNSPGSASYQFGHKQQNSSENHIASVTNSEFGLATGEKAFHNGSFTVKEYLSQIYPSHNFW